MAGVSPTTVPTNPSDPSVSLEAGQQQQQQQQHQHQPSPGSLPVPAHPGDHRDSIEVPASRPSISDPSAFMHNLSLGSLGSLKSGERRVSRNSFGTSLPIPRSPHSQRSSTSGYFDRDSNEAARIRRDLLASQLQDLAKEKVAAAKNMAFVFDIDGVLVHHNTLIPEATRALELLNGDNELGIKIPYIMLTNGGGKSESARTEQLSHILGQPISTNQFIQSHTPMQALSEYYETVLVVGGEGFRARAAAENYGFANVVLPKDILAWDPSISPWRAFTEEERQQARPRDFSRVKFDAILIFGDSYDWATDYQIILDLLLSENGKLGTRAADPTANQIPIYFSNADLVFPTEYRGGPRMTVGSFRIAIEALFKAHSGGDLERVIYGKPELAAYKYADEVIQSWMKEIHNEYSLPQNIYMVGDNPQSDIIGGNMYGWNTCLVRTGVFQGGENDEQNPASFGVFDTVLHAVQAVVKKELGTDFKMKWSDKVNPLLRTESIPAIE